MEQGRGELGKKEKWVDERDREEKGRGEKRDWRREEEREFGRADGYVEGGEVRGRVRSGGG